MKRYVKKKPVNKITKPEKFRDRHDVYSDSQKKLIKEVIIREMAEHGLISRAARNIGVPLPTCYSWARADPDWWQACKDASEWGARIWEEEAVRRAVEGYDEPITWQGQITAHKKAYSDALMNTILKARLPEYRKIDEKEKASVTWADLLGLADD